MDPSAAHTALAAVAGAALGLLLAGLLWARGESPRGTNAWLAAAIAALVLLVAARLLMPQRTLLTEWAAFGFGPCLWLYACRITGQTGPRGQRLAVHFIPAAALLLVLLPKASQPRAAPDTLYVLTALHMLAYWLLASLRLGRAGLPRLRVRLWICMAAWAVWIAAGP